MSATSICELGIKAFDLFPSTQYNKLADLRFSERFIFSFSMKGAPFPNLLILDERKVMAQQVLLDFCLTIRYVFRPHGGRF